MRRARFVALFCCLSGLSSAGLLVGCAGTAATTGSVATVETSGGDAPTDDVAADERVRVLESQLAESTAEARSLRAELDAARDRHEVVRIGEPRTSSEDATDAEERTVVLSDSIAPADDERSSGGSRPVLRLYGPPAPLGRPALSSDVAALPGPVAPPIVAAPPIGALDRLPVVVTPGAPDEVPAIPDAPIIVAAPSPTRAAPAIDGPAEIEYRAALAHVSAHRWDAALAALSAFVTAHPDHPYADNAMYWRGEVLYAERDYAAAITELTSMIEHFPSGNKVPDALLRIGFCFQRLGESERARQIFRRVRDQYPGTVAARTASREDA
jgi:tol-pal system protein YbgF